MEREKVRALLDAVRAGEQTVDAALQALRALPYVDLGGFATIDHHRALRRGYPEVVFGAGKTVEQIIAIVREISSAGSTVLVTRVDTAAAQAICQAIPDMRYEADARALVFEARPWEDRGRGVVALVSAGTSDRNVAEEAAITAYLMGNRVERVHDVGVSGLHRLLGKREVLERATVVIVVAGMEGALPSVVGGLVDCPVVAVPTSIGYGASFGGLAALLSMLNSCASGVTVVNIDNGFGAGYAAALINRREQRNS